MLFHTWTFLLFFAIAWPLFRAIKGDRGRRMFILACSYIFYGWWNPLYLLLISWIICADFTAVQLMAKTGRKKLFLYLSIANNIAVLGFFKYANFIIENFNSLMDSAGIAYALPHADILLPVGISFYIFQSMSYTIDYYYGKVERETNLIQYAAFVSFFPQLVAGPIERASHLLPQMKKWPVPNREDIALGIYIFTCGMFKKIALADYFAVYSDRIFANPMQYGAGDLLAGALAFTWQIYFDFGGYTDMARGIASMMGIDLMENFKMPYLSRNPSEFWSRWHISLSSWFRDYVYIPLGGNRKGRLRETGNVFATMLLSGLWHGAAWNFVLWGFIHSLLHVGSKKAAKINFLAAAPVFLKRITMFIIIIFTWIFFRSENASDAFIIIERIFTTEFSLPAMPAVMAFMIAACYLYEWVLEYRKSSFTRTPLFKAGAMVFMIAYLAVFASYGISEFIYFQF